MTRLFDRQLAQPVPPSLYDFLQTALADGSRAPAAARVRAMLTRPEAVRLARNVRPGGTGLLVHEVRGARVVAAEAVHQRVSHLPAPALFARLRDRSVLPRQELTFIEAQKLTSLGPVSAFGWLVTTRPAAEGHDVQAALATEWGRGKLLSPLAVAYLYLDGQGRYLREPDTNNPAIRIAYPDDPHRPHLLPSILEPLMGGLMATVGTLLASLAVLAQDPPLREIAPDPACSAAYRRQTGRALVSYCKIQQEAAVEDLFVGLDTTP